MLINKVNLININDKPKSFFKGLFAIAFILLLAVTGINSFAIEKEFREQLIYTYSIADSRVTAKTVSTEIIKEQFAIKYWYQLDSAYKKQLINIGINQDEAISLILASLHDLPIDSEQWQSNIHYKISYNWYFDTQDIFFKLLEWGGNEPMVGHISYIYLKSKEQLNTILDLYSQNQSSSDSISKYQESVRLLSMLIDLRTSIILNYEQEFLLSNQTLLRLQEPISSELTTKYYIASNYLSLNKIEDALFYINSAMEVSPENISLSILKGEALKAQNKSNQAISIWENALSFDSNYSYNIYKIASLFKQANEIELQIKALNIAIEKKPNPDALYYLALHETDSKVAIKNLNRAVDLQPNYWQAYKELGRIYYDDKNLDLAIENYRIALSIKNNDVETLILLADSYLDNNQIELALLYYQQAIYLSPDDKYITERLSKLKSNQ